MNVVVHVVPLPARQAAAGNRKPVFSNCSRYQASVREEQNPGTEVIRVTAVDRDPPDTGGTVTYTFVSAPGERLKFDIDPDTGRIVTRNVSVTFGENHCL
ncbi:hypothetical protein B566_EDAN010037 [Ephemera danica]|nr:hypothetical protein B566_EDAN010037 [Ephemera danica]